MERIGFQHASGWGRIASIRFYERDLEQETGGLLLNMQACDNTWSLVFSRDNYKYNVPLGSQLCGVQASMHNGALEGIGFVFKFNDNTRQL